MKKTKKGRPTRVERMRELAEKIGFNLEQLESGAWQVGEDVDQDEVFFGDMERLVQLVLEER